MSNEARPAEQWPEEIGFSMAPFGYTVTLVRYLDGAYGCGGKDGCHAKHWPHVRETIADFKSRMREHVDAAH